MEPKTFINQIYYSSLNITVYIYKIGSDPLILICGGDKPHIGSITTSFPETETSSLEIALPGHKDYYISSQVSNLLSKRQKESITVICGIHYDDFSIDILEEIDQLIPVMTADIEACLT